MGAEITSDDNQTIFDQEAMTGDVQPGDDDQPAAVGDTYQDLEETEVGQDDAEDGGSEEV